MDYLMLIFSDILLALNFVVTKEYQNREGVGFGKSLRFNIIWGIISAGMFFVLHGFKAEVNLYSLIMSVMQAALCVLYTMIGFKIMAEGKIAVYTIFLMAGGMIVPYIWGLLFLNEQFSYMHMVGLIVIVIAIFISNFDGNKIKLQQLLLCLCVFVLNGFVSVISKEHQISGLGVSTMGFCMLSSISKSILCIAASLILRLFTPKKMQNQASGKTLFIIALAAIFSGISYLFQLIAATELPATVLYPVVTGGSTVLTSIFGWVFFKEGLTKTVITGIVLCTLGTCLFL